MNRHTPRRTYRTLDPPHLGPPRPAPRHPDRTRHRGRRPPDGDRLLPLRHGHRPRRLLDENHQPIYYREEVYEHPDGNDLIVHQDRWVGHQKPGEPGYQPAHVHVRPFDNTGNGQVPGCEEHHCYDR
ncbi:HNH/endonuclease VII fold putative polymorphic toxin [Streptomyces griseoluteus]|uniref:HNH/endonuclease VII fold putative polymorphic toxin n=1 Tax=Streptomyces griseoluteus TaxID=29306 RepID=UPI0036F6FC33